MPDHQDGRRPIMHRHTAEYREWRGANPEGYVLEFAAWVIHRSACAAVRPTEETGVTDDPGPAVLCSGDAPPLEVVMLRFEGEIVRCGSCRPERALHGGAWGGDDVWR